MIFTATPFAFALGIAVLRLLCGVAASREATTHAKPVRALLLTALLPAHPCEELKADAARGQGCETEGFFSDVLAKSFAS